MPSLFWELLQKHLSPPKPIDDNKEEKTVKKRKYSEFSLETCNEPNSPWYTGPMETPKLPTRSNRRRDTVNKQSNLPTRTLQSFGRSDKLLSSTIMDDDDDDLEVPLKRVPKKNKKALAILSSDSDEPIFIEEKTPTMVKKKVVHRAEIADDDLDEKTRRAMKEQLERDARIKARQEREELVRIERAQKQNEYNGELIAAYEEKLQQPVEFELVLETDPQTSNIVVEVDLMLVKDMKRHQVEGVKFLWSQVFESTPQIAASFNRETNLDRGGSGAILAHCMGLGKTFTTIALIHTLFRYPDLIHVHRVLILCPLNTAINWKSEFRKWIGDLEPTIDIYLFNADDVPKKERAQFLRRWYEKGGILLMGYEMYRLLNYASDESIGGPRKKTPKPKEIELSDDDSSENDRFSKKKKAAAKSKSKSDMAAVEKYRKYLRHPGPDLIVCDEGHMIKNPKSVIARMVNKVRTQRRIILTGTPMQNNLKEYFAMVNFCKPNFLGTEMEFSRNFRIPIEAGQHKDSSPGDVAYMRRRAYALNQRLKTILHRRDFDVLRAFLPPKFEYAVKIKCRPLQQELYQTYLLIQDIDPTAKLNMAKLLGDYQYLMKIWTHPWLLRPHFIDSFKKYLKGENQVETDEFFQDDPEEIEDNDGINTRTQKRIQQPINQATAIARPTISKYFNDYDSMNSSRSKIVLDAMKKEWWYDMFESGQAQFDIELSGKFVLLKAILDECESIGDKLLVFTRSILALNYIEEWLEHWNAQAPLAKWQKGIDYFRMDGKVPIQQRAADIKLFNDVDKPRGRLFLISTTAGGIGINLYSANRVIIFDASWNPAHDLQAMFRSYRLGQKKPVYIYRLMGKGTMEEKIYKRQITKQAMSQRVIDAKQTDRHFTNDELAQLYRFEPTIDNDPLDKYDADRVKDKILRRLMDEYADTIVSYREHDSLLIHRDEENLTAEEKKQAQDEENMPFARRHRHELVPPGPSIIDLTGPPTPGQVIDFFSQNIT